MRATAYNRGAAAVARWRGRRTRRERPAAPAAFGTTPIAVEDVLLAGWFVVLEHLLGWQFGADPLLWLSDSDPLATVGSVIVPGGTVTLGLLAFLIFTRGPADTSRDAALHRRTFLLWLLLPLLSIYSLIATAAQRWWYLRAHPEARTSSDAHPWFSDDPPWPGPPVGTFVRRSAALPVALLGDALFRVEANTIQAHAFTSVGIANVFGILASVAPFVLFVAGPRIVAGDTLAVRAWVARFALFWTAPLLAARLWS